MVTGYTLIGRDRSDGRRGGGVGEYVKNIYRCSVIDSLNDIHLEQIWLKFIVVYRPPYFSNS